MVLELDTTNRRLVATICNEIEGTYVANGAALKLSYYKDLFHRTGVCDGNISIAIYQNRLPCRDAIEMVNICSFILI